jgi:hypothetical protein
MARKSATITISAEGRDQGKVFHIKELPAMQAERWATRALLALAKSGVEIPDDIASAGLAGVASLGMKAFAGLNYDDAEPLLAEMLACVSVIPDPSNPNIMRSDIESDIEEVATLLKLRSEVFKLHVNFSTPGVSSESTPPTTGRTHRGTRNM